MFSRWSLVLLLLGSGLTLGCASSASTPAAQLAGREFLLDSADGFTAVTGTTVRVSFDDREEGPSFALHAGCNHHSGTYRWEAGRFELSSLASTEIGCETALVAQDAWLVAFFTSSPTMSLDGDRLTFVSDSITLVFLDREVADPDRPLTGRTWTIDTFILGGAASNLPVSDAPTVTFGDDGTVDVFSGCNSGSGTYEQSGDRLTLSPIPYTERGCPDAAATQAESQVQAVLTEGEVDLEIEANRLTLTRDGRGLSATTE